MSDHTEPTPLHHAIDSNGPHGGLASAHDPRFVALFGKAIGREIAAVVTEVVDPRFDRVEARLTLAGRLVIVALTIEIIGIVTALLQWTAF